MVDIGLAMLLTLLLFNSNGDHSPSSEPYARLSTVAMKTDGIASRVLLKQQQLVSY